MRTIFILWQYIARKFLYYFLIVIMILLSIIFVVDYVELIRRLAGSEISQSDILLIGVYKLPYYFHLTLPFVILISSIISYSKMKNANEIIAANSSGISIWYVIFPFIAITLVIGILHITVFNQLLVISFKKHLELSNRYFAHPETEISFSDRGIWLKDIEKGNVNKIIFAKTLYDRGELLSEVTIYQSPFDREYASIITADIASFINNQIKLEDVTIFSKNNNKAIKKSEYFVHTNISIDKIHNSIASPETMSLFQFPTFIKNMEKTGFASNAHRLYFYNLIILPFTLVGYVLIAMSVSTSIKIHNKSEVAIFISIIISLIGYFIIKVMSVTIQNSSDSILLAITVPVIVVYLLSLAMILHNEDG